MQLTVDCAVCMRRGVYVQVRRVMWRNSRRDVAAELHLPPQGQTVTWLRPSGIEAHWYNQQRKVCEGAAREALFRIKHPHAHKRGKGNASSGGGGGGGGGGCETAPASGVDAELSCVAARGGGAWSAVGPGRKLGGGAGMEDEFRDLIDNGDDDSGEDGDVEMQDAEGSGGPSSGAAVDLTNKQGSVDDDDEAEDRYLTSDESRRVLAPLLRLRQACNHPQAGTHGVRGFARGHHGGRGGGGGGGAGGYLGAGGIHSGVIMTMPQIHAVLIERQRTEAEEAQRLVAFTLNASAGVACCRGRWPEAVGHYREVLRLEAAGAADGLGLRLDSLQRLHALHNLQLALTAATTTANTAAGTGATVGAVAGAGARAAGAVVGGGSAAAAAATGGGSVGMDVGGGEGDGAGIDDTTGEPLRSSFAGGGVSHALRDASLAADAETERQKYVAQRAGGCGVASSDLRKSSVAVEDALRRCGARGRSPAGCAWWSGVIDAAAASADRGRPLLDRILDNQRGLWQGREVNQQPISLKPQTPHLSPRPRALSLT